MNTIQKKRRTAMILNYLSVIVMLVLFYLVKLQVLKMIYLVLEIIPIVVIILTFRNAFIKSSIWKLTHSSSKELDEREMHLVLHATNISYSLFAIAILVIIYVFILSGLGQIDAVLAISLLYFAHILPASVIAWNEKGETLE